MQFIVIDFEATCDEPHNPVPQEIIEFPAILVDPQTDADREFHTFVRPVVHPRLTRFCAELTGIRQQQIDQAPGFSDALAQFEDWWRTHCQPDALVVTCGDWDLGSLLPRQCEQHRLGLPEWANRWANLQRIFSWEFPHASDQTRMSEMASALGMPLFGRLHSGMDDSRNLARIVRRLLALGVSLEHTAFWRCLGCGSENLYRLRACQQCGKSSVTLQPGDWACSRCGFGNFARRDKCYDCGAPRNAGQEAPRNPGQESRTSAPIPMKRGDWLCSLCGEHNFARRTGCYKCGAVRQ